MNAIPAERIPHTPLRPLRPGLPAFAASSPSRYLGPNSSASARRLVG
jgi:hypothetical protein